ncbi:hypothetical protein ES703_53670 [subsurface metagenome]
MGLQVSSYQGSRPTQTTTHLHYHPFVILGRLAVRKSLRTTAAMKHPLLTYDMYKALWLQLWEKEKEQRRWERRGVYIRDLHRREWPRKPVGVRPYDPAYHSWYITKQVTWCNMPFDSLGVFTNCPRFSDKRFPRVSECNLKRVFAKEVERLNARPNKVPLFNWLLAGVKGGFS